MSEEVLDEQEQQPQDGDGQVTDPSEGQTEQSHDVHKGLQKFQQDFSAYQRKMDERLESISQRLESAATPRQRQAAQDDLDRLVSDERAEFDDGQIDSKVISDKIRYLAGEVRNLREENQRLGSQHVQTYQDLTGVRFRQDNPELADKFNDIRQEAVDLFKQEVGDIQDVRARTKLWEIIQRQVVDKHRQAAKDLAGQTPTTGEAPRQTKGTKIASGNGALAAPTASAKRSPMSLSKARELIFGGEM